MVAGRLGGRLGAVLTHIVDALPVALWRPANRHLGGRLHFCTNGVRTVEWNGHQIAQGQRAFPYDEVQRRWPDESE